MKKGDLVKLCWPAGWQRRDDVSVSWTNPEEEMESGDGLLETSFSVGTAAVFLGSRKYEWWEQKIAHIIIDGRRGWVFENEIEPL